MKAGTWTNYGTTPKNIVLLEKGARGDFNVGIVINNGPNSPTTLTFDGTPIYETQRGSVTVKSRSSATLKKLRADVYAVLKASSYPFKITPKDSNTRNRHIVSFDVEILTN